MDLADLRLLIPAVAAFSAIAGALIWYRREPDQPTRRAPTLKEEPRPPDPPPPPPPRPKSPPAPPPPPEPPPTPPPRPGAPYGKLPTFPAVEELMPHLAKVKERPDPLTWPQRKALYAMGLKGRVGDLTNGQAGALMSAWRYAEGAILQVTGKADGYPDEKLVEAALVAFIVKDDRLRKRALAHNRLSRRYGRNAPPKPKQDEHFFRVRAEATRILSALRHAREQGLID